MICPARSGSTSMRLSLNQHPEVVCHGELLGARAWGFVSDCYHPTHQVGTPDKATGFRSSSMKEFLKRAFGDGLNCEVRAVGFKVLYEQLLRPEAEEARSLIASDDEIKIIHNWRRDLLARFMSDRTYRIRHSAKEKTKAISIELPVQQMLSDFDRQVEMREQVNRVFANHRRLEVFYEDVVSAKMITGVPEFLGLSKPVPLTPIHIDLAPKVEVVVANADELRVVAEQGARHLG